MIYYCIECDTAKDSDYNVATFTTDDKPICENCWYEELEKNQGEEK